MDWQSVLRIALFAVLSLPPPLAAAEPWLDSRQIGPMACFADFNLESQRPLMDDLARLEKQLTLHLGVPPVREEIRVYLFRDRSGYDAYLRRHLPNVPYRRALYVKNGEPGMVLAYRHSQFDVDLRHECTHALLHAALSNVPLWLDEGLAGHFEMPSNRRAFGHPHLAEIQKDLRFGSTPPLAALEARMDVTQMGAAEYRQAWAWVHFMLYGPREAHEELVRFLAESQNSARPLVLSDRLAARIPHVDRRFREHFLRWRP